MRFEKIKYIKYAGKQETSDLIVERNHNFIANNFIVHNSGYGKGLALAGLAQTLHECGYNVIVLADPKDKLEFAFSMFEPEEQYHLNELRRVGVHPKAMPVKLYHPFTFNLPRALLPDMNLFTIPIKDLTADEFSLLAETKYQTEAVRLFMQSADLIQDSAGIYGFLHKIQELVKGKRQGKEIKPSPQNFWLEATTGTLKGVMETSSLMQQFKTDYFLSSKNCFLNLNFKELLQDNKNYHVFVYNYMPYKKNKKIRDFLVLSLVSQIITHLRYATTPLCLVIPEVGNQMPVRPEGHEKFLADSLRRLITTCRSMGRGITTLSDNQSYTEVDESYADSSTVLFLGKLGGGHDVERVVKKFGYKQEMRKRLINPEYKNSFTLVGYEDEQFYIRFPSHMWAEAQYNFEEMFRKKKSEKMQNYSEIIDRMRTEYEAEENRFKLKAKAKDESRRREHEAKKKAKEERDSDDKSEKKVERAKTIEDEAKQKLMKLLYEYHLENPNLSVRKLAVKFGLTHPTAKKYLEKMKQEDTEEEEEEFDEEILEEEN